MKLNYTKTSETMLRDSLVNRNLKMTFGVDFENDCSKMEFISGINRK